MALTNWVKFNINNRVRVKLTDHGRAVLRLNYHIESVLCGGLPFPYTPPKEDENGVSEWQMWHLMREFGKHIEMSGPLLFNTAIEVACDPEQIGGKP